MKLYWNYIVSELSEIWVATKIPLKNGDFIRFRDTIGYIERQKDGSYSCYNGSSNYFLGNEPNKNYAMELVANQALDSDIKSSRTKSY